MKAFADRWPIVRLMWFIRKILPFAREALLFEVVPHVGILPICLDATREDVAKRMRDLGHTKSSTLGQTDRYIDGSVGVEFDKNDRVQFVELFPHRDLAATFFGVNVFDRPAEEVFSLIAEREGNDLDTFDPQENLFRRQIVALWHADPQYDLGGERFPVWGAIGVGNRSYLQNVDALDAKL